MQETATVIGLDGEWAKIRVQRSLACQSCNACGYSYANHMMEGRARNVAGADLGDCVRIEVPTRHVVAAASLVYLLPIVTMVAGYGVVALVLDSRVAAALGSLAGLALGMWFVKVLGDRLTRAEEFEPVVHAIIRPNPDREVD